MEIPKFAQWPGWVQLVVVGPHAALGAILLYFWWPRDRRGWRRFSIAFGYLLVFYAILYFVFDFK